MRSSESYKKSFLDELLGEDSDKIEIPKRPKSVRFVERSGDILDSFGLSAEASDVQRSNEGKSTAQTSRSFLSAASAKSDWLGLLDNEPSSLMSTDSQPSNVQTTSDEWISEGLSGRRRSKQQQQSQQNSQIETKQQPLEKNEESTDSWLNMKKVITEKAKKETPIQSDVQETSEKKETSTQLIKPAMESNIASHDALMLKAQIDILELEKKHLNHNIEQLKNNHEQEIKIMKTLHEQQMKMTTEMFKQQEEMLRAERDRRIADLQTQLIQSEKEKEEMRSRYNERLHTIENDCHAEVERLKDIHNQTVKRLIEQQEEDIGRIRRIKEQEIDAINKLQSQGLGMQTLLSKWEENAAQIEEFHKKVLSKQEEILREKVNNLETKDKRLQELEFSWSSLRDELRTERSRVEDTRQKLLDLIEEQKMIINREQEKLLDEKSEIYNEKRRFEEEKRNTDSEIQRLRNALEKDLRAVKEERNKLNEERLDFEAKKGQFQMKEVESKHQLQREKDEINKANIEIQEDRNTLSREQMLLQNKIAKLQNEQQRFEQRKVLFDAEREKLQELAQKIVQRAEELEAFSQIVAKDRKEGLDAKQVADALKAEVDMKVDLVEKRVDELKKEERKLEREKQKVLQEWKALQEVKSNVLCSLCGSSLNRAKFIEKEYTQYFNSLANGYSNITDKDRSLLVWQITAQQDAALLAEETAFIEKLRKTGEIEPSGR